MCKKILFFGGFFECVWGVGIRRGKNLNFTHQKVNKLNFGDFPLHCIPTCALGGKAEDAIKGQEDEGGMGK